LPVLIGAGIAIAGVVAVAPASGPSRPFVPLMALAAGGTLALIPVRHPKRWLATAGLLVIGGAVLAASVSASRLTVSSPDRANEWRTTWNVAAAHPLTGVGPSRLALEWRDADGQTSGAHATHNEFLQLAAEQGVPALVVALVTIAAIALALARRLERTALAVLAAFLVASAFDFIWHVPLVPIVVAALIGAALPFYDQNSSGARRYGRPAPTSESR
jgi:O-antigen ligase